MSARRRYRVRAVNVADSFAKRGGIASTYHRWLWAAVIQCVWNRLEVPRYIADFVVEEVAGR